MPDADSSIDKEQNPHSTKDSSADGKEVGTLTAFRIRNFRFLFANGVISQAGGWIQQITMNWLVYNLTHSGTMLGTLSTIRSVTSLGMIPVAGVLTDRVEHRKLMMITNAWLFFVTFLFGLVLVYGKTEVGYLFAFAFFAGLPYTIDNTVKQVVIFDLIPRKVTPNAIALLLTGSAVMRSIGPAVGGFLILWKGPGGNFLVQAGAYALIAISIMQLRFPEQKYDVKPSSALQNIKEGLRYVAKERVTRTFVFMGFILPIFTIPVFTILPPIFAVKVFGDGSARILSYLMAAMGVGSIFGGIFAAALSRLERRGLVQLASLFMLALSLIGFAFCTDLWLALLLLVFGGFFESIFLTSNQILLQLSIPDELRGRVTSVLTLNVALSPVGGLIAGIGSDMLGGPKMITIVLAGTAACIAVLVLIFSPTVRNYRISQGIASNTRKAPDSSST